VASGTVSDLVGQCGASGHSGCIGAVSGLHGRGVCWGGSVAGASEVSELARVHRRGWVGLGSMRYSSQCGVPHLCHSAEASDHASQDLQVGRAKHNEEDHRQCNKTNPPFSCYHLFPYLFTYQNNPTRHGQGDSTIGRPEDQPEDIRLDNHFHRWLAKPTTLRWSAHDLPNQLPAIQTHRQPSAQTMPRCLTLRTDLPICSSIVTGVHGPFLCYRSPHFTVLSPMEATYC
jgi:hypothetical protein